MLLDIGARSDIGRRKDRNEDNYGVFREDTPNLKLFDEGTLLVVADGLGGHVGGEIASKLAVSVFADMLKEERPDEEQTDNPEEACKNLQALFRDFLSRANANIYRTNQDLVKQGKPMGTTLAAALVEPKRVHVINVGDSRCYHIRNNEIISRSQDHSWVDEQVKMGNMTKEKAKADRRRNLVTRCIGTHPEVDADTYLWHVVPGDRLLLCTDGLVNMVDDAAICNVFEKGGTAQDVADKLVDLANENGGKDNITVIVAEISPKRSQLVARRLASFWGAHGRKIIWALLTLLFGLACFGAGLFARPYIW